MSFCTKCGSELKEGSKFCTGCGQPVVSSQSPLQPENNQMDKSNTNQNVNKMVYILQIVQRS